MKLAGVNGATQGVAACTVHSSEPERELGTDSADTFGSLTADEYKRAKRLFDATPSDCPDEKRLAHVKGVLRMIADRVRAK